MKKILVIDDDHDLVATLEDAINMTTKFHARGAHTMDLALELLSNGGGFDVILLDLQGGDIDRARIGEIARELGVKVITMSGSHELSPALQKPFNIEDLEEVVLKY